MVSQSVYTWLLTLTNCYSAVFQAGSLLVLIAESRTRAYLASIVPMIVNTVLNEHQLVLDIVAFVSRGDFPRSRLGEKQRGKILASWVSRKMQTIAQFSIRDPEVDGSVDTATPDDSLTRRVSPQSGRGARNSTTARSSLRQVESADQTPRSSADASLLQRPEDAPYTHNPNPESDLLLDPPSIPGFALSSPPADDDIPDRFNAMTPTQNNRVSDGSYPIPAGGFDDDPPDQAAARAEVEHMLVGGGYRDEEDYDPPTEPTRGGLRVANAAEGDEVYGSWEREVMGELRSRG